MALTSISDRLTPSVPIELTFGAQPIATGRKISTLFGHRAASGGSANDYDVIEVVNVGDPDQAKSEVDLKAGAGSELGQMAYAFVAANALSGGSNFPAFRIVVLPNSELHFGPASEGILAIKGLRNDMLVSCYPASDTTNRASLIAVAELMSGPDRDLQGQFGSFVTMASLEALSAQVLYAINSRKAIVACLPDSNTALVTQAADLTSGSNILVNLASTVGIYPGAVASGAGIPAGTLVQQVTKSTVMLSASVTASASAESVAFQNQVSQSVPVLAAAHAGRMMASAFPYNPLQGVTIGGLKPPQKVSDRIDINPQGASEQALIAGLSPLYVQAGGHVGFIRTRTTYNLLPDNVTAATAYFDWQDLAVMNDFREDCYSITQNPPFNNNPGGTKASKQIAGLLKDEILRQAQAYEDRGAFQAVKALAPQFQIAPSATSRGRFDFKIPVNVLPGLFVIAGNIQGVTTFDFTL